MQRHRGWVSDEALRDVAALLGMTADELDGVATFYNLIFRKPVGRHVILVCDSVSCWIMGYDAVARARSEQRLGIRLRRRPPPTTASRCCRSSASAPATCARR